MVWDQKSDQFVNNKLEYKSNAKVAFRVKCSKFFKVAKETFNFILLLDWGKIPKGGIQTNKQEISGLCYGWEGHMIWSTCSVPGTQISEFLLAEKIMKIICK